MQTLNRLTNRYIDFVPYLENAHSRRSLLPFSSLHSCCTCYQNNIVIIFRPHCLISAATVVNTIPEFCRPDHVMPTRGSISEPPLIQSMKIIWIQSIMNDFSSWILIPQASDLCWALHNTWIQNPIYDDN